MLEWLLEGRRARAAWQREGREKGDVGLSVRVKEKMFENIFWKYKNGALIKLHHPVIKSTSTHFLYFEKLIDVS